MSRASRRPNAPHLFSPADEARARVIIAEAPTAFDDLVPVRDLLAKALASIDDLRRQLNARSDPDESTVRHSATESYACPTPMRGFLITVCYWLTPWNQPGPLLGHLRTRFTRSFRA